MANPFLDDKDFKDLANLQKIYHHGQATDKKMKKLNERKIRSTLFILGALFLIGILFPREQTEDAFARERVEIMRNTVELENDQKLSSKPSLEFRGDIVPKKDKNLIERIIKVVQAKIESIPNKDIENFIRSVCVGASCPESRIQTAIANAAILEAVANKYGVNPIFLVALAWHESGLRADAINCGNDNGTCDKGILQWNDVHLERIPDSCRLDVRCAAEYAAHDIKYGKESQWCAVGLVYEYGYRSNYK